MVKSGGFVPEIVTGGFSVAGEPVSEVVVGVDEVGARVPKDEVGRGGFEPAVTSDGKKEGAEGGIEGGEVGGGKPGWELFDGDGIGEGDEVLEPGFGIDKTGDFDEFLRSAFLR